MCQEACRLGARFFGRTHTGWCANGPRSRAVGNTPDQLAEAMFAFSRLDNDKGPLQTYLCLSEIDRVSPPAQRMSDQTVVLLADKFADFSDQYLIFTEFPQLTDASITRFLTTAEALNKISDHALRGNAMGTFQASVGLWQIWRGKDKSMQSHLNSSWLDVIGPFSRFTTPAQLVTAGRNSILAVFRAATGKPTDHAGRNDQCSCRRASDDRGKSSGWDRRWQTGFARCWTTSD